MANIMITKKCNLACPYCFANEFVNAEKSENMDITIENFQKILDFIVGDGSVKSVGLIGGEPTCHKNFDDILDILIDDVRVENVTVYTNGILLEHHIEKLNHPKIHLLVNSNDLSYNEILQKQFLKSLDKVFCVMGDRTILGANYYKPDYDYDYILRLVEKYQCKKLRVSVSVPNKKDYNYQPLEYFRHIKPFIFKFFLELKVRGVLPYLDCNIFPACLVTAEDMLLLDEFGAENPLSILKNRPVGCVPVIDIMPDFTAVRCFGLSEYTKVNINEFASISDLRNYYLRSFDAYAVNTFHSEQCEDCYKYKTMKCFGGCLIYKIDKIIGIKNMVDKWNMNY